ncbi:hypothetical protein CCH79_00020513 [Gambusia affinis]|uniref:Uncharacterized protein n=1 Tax=Gambusia affinis TaxID=33528 RepID=A0A315W8L0_GAMAF|nr:hypothetical protein CCH79_00020513 [Gambusia affinis]
MWALIRQQLYVRTDAELLQFVSWLNRNTCPPPVSSVAMSVMSSVMRAARLLRSSAPLLTWPQSRGLASKQVKGQRKEQKKLKVDKQEVEIRQGMTAAALAAAMNRDFDHVLEALLNTPADLDSLRPDSVLEDSWIKEAVIRSGMKFRWAKLSESRERPNRDAQRRYGTGLDPTRPVHHPTDLLVTPLRPQAPR